MHSQGTENLNQDGTTVGDKLLRVCQELDAKHVKF